MGFLRLLQVKAEGWAVVMLAAGSSSLAIDRYDL
jgi:hypothetical protein